MISWLGSDLAHEELEPLLDVTLVGQVSERRGLVFHARAPSRFLVFHIRLRLLKPQRRRAWATGNELWARVRGSKFTGLVFGGFGFVFGLELGLGLK